MLETMFQLWITLKDSGGNINYDNTHGKERRSSTEGIPDLSDSNVSSCASIDSRKIITSCYTTLCKINRSFFVGLLMSFDMTKVYIHDMAFNF